MDERTTLKHRALVGGAILPMGLALLMTQSIPVGRPVEGQVERPALAFSQYLVNLREVPPTGTVPVFFDFWNRGESDIEILKLVPSCGCLAPRLVESNPFFPPETRGRFVATVNTATEHPGPKDYAVDVQYRSGKEVKSGTVLFRLIVPEKKVTVAPREVLFYLVNGEADSAEIIVADHRGSKLEVVKTEITSDTLTVTRGDARTSAEGVWETPIRIDVPAGTQPGQKISLLKIQTNDPDYEEIRVPILVERPRLAGTGAARD